MIPITLVVGATGLQREQKIAGQIARQPRGKSAVLIEGLSSGQPLLESLEPIIVMRIAPGCLCCSNQLIMRTYLHRMIQQRPDHLYLSLANHEHLDQIQLALQSESYINILGPIDVLTLS
jgi:hypothetical protein